MYMGGVDKSDQLLEPYDATWKTMAWYKNLAIHLIQLALFNAHIEGAENARPENDEPRKIQGLKMQDPIMMDKSYCKIQDLKNNGSRKSQSLKMQDLKMPDLDMSKLANKLPL